MLRLGILACTLAAALAGGATRAEASGEAALCENAVVTGAQAGGVPQAVLHAVSLTETGRRQAGRLRPWPWTINREGRGYWFTTREEALAFARRSVAEGRPSFDVGCFQINHHWHGDKFPSLEAMFDPDRAAGYAAGFLRQLYDARGDWSAAAGAYHSRTPHLAARYRVRFDTILARLAGPLRLVAAPTRAAAPPRRSRTRMSARPLIITIKPDRDDPPLPAPPDPLVSASLENGAGVRISDSSPDAPPRPRF